MTRVARKDMRPGQMFVVLDPYMPLHMHDILVVLDREFEVGLWTGGTWNWGRWAPSVQFEVVSG